MQKPIKTLKVEKIYSELFSDKKLPAYNLKPAAQKIMKATIDRHKLKALSSGKKKDLNIFRKLIKDYNSHSAIKRIFKTNSLNER